MSYEVHYLCERCAEGTPFNDHNWSYNTHQRADMKCCICGAFVNVAAPRDECWTDDLYEPQPCRGEGEYPEEQGSASEPYNPYDHPVGAPEPQARTASQALREAIGAPRWWETSNTQLQPATPRVARRERTADEEFPQGLSVCQSDDPDEGGEHE